MTPDEPNETRAGSDDEAAQVPEGVFGNLPQTRPGARSPRRDTAGAQQSRGSGTRATSRREPAASTVPDPPVAAGSGTRAESAPAPAADEVPDPSVAGEVPDPTVADATGGGIEEVAWAGVAAAAEAATIGVRLATRALEAMRDAVDRR